LPTYKVHGTKYLTFETTVEAADPLEAVEIANERQTHQWFLIEDDDVIEATDVFLDEDTSGQLKLNIEEWPSMESGILIEGTN